MPLDGSEASRVVSAVSPGWSPVPAGSWATRLPTTKLVIFWHNVLSCCKGPPYSRSAEIGGHMILNIVEACSYDGIFEFMQLIMMHAAKGVDDQ